MVTMVRVNASEALAAPKVVGAIICCAVSEKSQTARRLLAPPTAPTMPRTMDTSAPQSSSMLPEPSIATHTSTKQDGKRAGVVITAPSHLPATSEMHMSSAQRGLGRFTVSCWAGSAIGRRPTSKT